MESCFQKPNRNTIVCPHQFQLQSARCIFCGNCEEVCPEEAIVMSKEYDIVFLSREDAIYGKDRLMVPKEQLKNSLQELRINLGTFTMAD